MAMHSDPRQWPAATATPTVPGACQAFDWQELVARLAAVSEARMALAHARNFASGHANGSFDPDCARMLGSFARPAPDDEPVPECDHPPFPIGVNRVDSGRGKSRSTITGDTAGIDTAGDRGLK